MRLPLLPLLAALVLPACAPRASLPSSPSAPVLRPYAATPPALDGQPTAPVAWVAPTGQSLIYAADEDRGIEVYALDGRRLADHAVGPVESLSLIYGVEVGAGTVDLLVAADQRGQALRLFEAGGAALPELGRIALDTRPERVCMHRQPQSGAVFAFVIGEAGRVQQMQLTARDGDFALRPIRDFEVGGDVEACAADDRSGALYLAEAETAIWRYDTDPEADLRRRAVDVAAPLGGVEAVSGLALVAGEAAGLLLAADESASQLHLYALEAPNPRLGVVNVEGVAHPEGVAALAAAGVPLAVHNGAGGAPAFALVELGPALRALGLPPLAPRSPRARGTASMPAVRPNAETEPVASEGDAADDPAIWVNPADPAQSLIVASQKQFGLLLYDLQGRELQSIPAGRINNVDLRDGFALAGRTVALVAASNRSDDAISFFALDPASRRLQPIGSAPTGLREPYGLCLYRSAKDAAFYVFVNDTGGRYRQWRIAADGTRVVTEPVREFALPSQPEGCVADDETGVLYLGEEGEALYRMGAEPDAGVALERIDQTGEGGHLVADVEGMSLWIGEHGSGYLIVSSQGEDAYAVYERRPPNRYRGKFRIVANEALGIDGASETDGLDVTSADLGGDYARGLLVVQDGRNVAPPQMQNFKLVPWRAVERALALEPQPAAAE